MTKKGSRAADCVMLKLQNKNFACKELNKSLELYSSVSVSVSESGSFLMCLVR